MRPPVHLADLTRWERREFVAQLGLPAFRADQLSRHWFGRLSNDPTEWTDLGVGDRELLADKLLPTLLRERATVACDEGATRKTVWELAGGARVESVVMRYPKRVTVCVSTQAGCGMGCLFCATGQGGLTRNLSAGEIVEQVLAAARSLDAAGDGAVCADGADDGPVRVSNVVLMGMGEPLANYEATLRAVRTISEPRPHGLGLSARSITVSTVGLVPKIRQLASEGLAVTLAISLHAPTDELRDDLVPINKRWPIGELLSAADDYSAATGRRVSIEYALIQDVNDGPEQARELARILAGRGFHVNLIPLNPTPGSDWVATSALRQADFVAALSAQRVPVTVRDNRGRQIGAACGQLAATG